MPFGTIFEQNPVRIIDSHSTKLTLYTILLFFYFLDMFIYSFFIMVNGLPNVQGFCQKKVLFLNVWPFHLCYTTVQFLSTESLILIVIPVFREGNSANKLGFNQGFFHLVGCFSVRYHALWPRTELAQLGQTGAATLTCSEKKSSNCILFFEPALLNFVDILP